MKKIDFIRMLAEESGETQVTIRNVLDSLESCLVKVCKAQDDVSFSGIKVKGEVKEAHTGRNPSTGETIMIPEKIRVSLKTLKSFKDTVNE